MVDGCRREFDENRTDSLEDQLHDMLAPGLRTGAEQCHGAPLATCGEPISIGPFAVEERIGRGGMGSVYRARHERTEIPVALKIIHRPAAPSKQSRFHEEVQAHAGLLHPGIVYLFEYGEIQPEVEEVAGPSFRAGSPFVAMELAERGTVREAMPLTSWRQVHRFLLQILDALAHAHAHGVIHRDLKPENFLLFDPERPDAERARVKLADFGIAHAFGEEDDRETDSLCTPIGTPLYMAPEQFLGLWRRYGPSTDLYALGCITWELVCGRPPFPGEEMNFVELSLRHRDAPRPPLEPRFPVPDGLEAWIHRCMAPSPERRYRRAADARWALPSADLAPSPPPRDETEPPAHGPYDSAVGPETDTNQHEETPGRAPTLASTTPHEDDSDLVWADTLPELMPSIDAPLRDEPHAPPNGEDLPTPTLPPTWRRGEVGTTPPPLIDAGLGLFGLRQAPFVGRPRERNRIWETIRHSSAEQSLQTLVIEGEAGTGKSRLAEWMAARSHAVGAADVLRAEHTPEGGPDEGLRGALERKFRTAKLDRSEVHDHLLESLPPLDGDEEEIWRHRDARALTEFLRPAAEGAGTDGPLYKFSSSDQKFAFLVRILRRLSRRRTLILWLDDLQWGPGAIGLLEHLRHQTDRPPAVTVLATLRPDVVVESPRLDERLSRLTESPTIQRLELEPLGAELHRELLSGLLPLEDRLAGRLAERTEGHPLFAMQLLAHWIERDLLVSGPEGFRLLEEVEVTIPEDIHDLWMDRIERLVDHYPEGESDDLLPALELAAALGRDVDEGEWRAALSEADIDPPPTLVDHLVERGLAERTNRGWSFTHGLLVDAIERRSREAGRWSTHHRTCAKMLASRPAPERLGPRERIADHWIEGDQPEAAVDPLLDEISLCWDRGENGARSRLLRRRGAILDDLEVPDDDRRRIIQRTEVARTIAHNSDLQRARQTATEIWDQLDPRRAELRSRTAHLLATIASRRTERRRARDWAERAVEASRETNSPETQYRAHLKLGWECYYDGDLDAAGRHAEWTIERAEECRRRFGVLEGLRLKALVQQSVGAAGSVELLATVRKKAAAHGHVAIEARAANCLGDAARFDGRLEEARRYYRQFLSNMEELRRPIPRTSAELNLAQVELRTGAFERAAERVSEARKRLAALGADNHRRGTLHTLRLGLAAGRRRRESFSEHWSRLERGWPTGWRLIRDHPWLLDTAAECAGEAGWTAKALEVWRLARTLYLRLGGLEERAASIETKIQSIRAETPGLAGE